MRLFLGLAAALLVAAPAIAATPVALRATPAARGGTITLADLFDGATGPAAQTVVAAAAAPGAEVVLDAGQVQLAAHAAGFDWENAQGQRRILVPTVPGGGPATGSRAPRRQQALAYVRNIAAGEIVQAADLVWSDAAVAGADAPGDPDRLIGQAARRPLRAGAPVQRGDLASPVVVHRDETIEVAFSAPGLALTLQGKALKDAAVGEPLQVLNPVSKKVIEAVASAPGRAVVGPAADALKAAPFATASLR